MNNPDLINSLFELFGGIFLWLSVYRLYKAKCYKGISIIPITFYALWGYWNLYYYPHLNQWLSFYAGFNVVASNTVWVIMALYYKNKGKSC